MKKIIEINIHGGADIFKHIADTLLPYHTKAVGSYCLLWRERLQNHALEYDTPAIN